MPETIATGAPIGLLARALDSGNGSRKIKEFQRCRFIPSKPEVLIDILRGTHSAGAQIGKEIFPVAICGNLRGAGINCLRERGGRSEVVPSRLPISQIDWFSEIALLQKMPP